MMTENDLSVIPALMEYADGIATNDMGSILTNNYIPNLTTKYYYTCEADGTVRQFDGPDVATAIEYVDIEAVVTLDVDLYSKPLEDE